MFGTARRSRVRGGRWDLSALINAADSRATQPERHLWLVRLMEWLRRAPGIAPPGDDDPRTPRPVLRLRLLLNQLDSQPALRERVQGLLQAFWQEIDAPSLFADFGFGARASLLGEVLTRLQRRWLPDTPETSDLAALFVLLFEPGDADWIAALDDTTLRRLAALLAPGFAEWRVSLLDAIDILASAVQGAGRSPALRRRMDPDPGGNDPFRQLQRAADALRSAVLEQRQADALREAQYLRAVLDACRAAGSSVTRHLEQYGISVDIVFALDQLQGRTARIEMLVDCLLAPPDALPEWRHLLAELLHALNEAEGLRTMLGRHYSMLARQVAERSAETGEHYITRNRAEYRDMLRRAAGGGAVIAGTTFVKFGIMALGLSAFWGGFWAGTNYGLSFLLVMLLHWTVATKQPAMTAPAMAASLPATGVGSDEAIEQFVDRVAQLIRSQVAGIAGNLALCAPLVLLVQWLSTLALGKPLVGAKEGHYVLHSISLLGPTALFAAFTGVLLFASSLVAGWAENWFVLHRLDSAIAWNPRILARLGPQRARRWADWWRANISGVAANLSLGLMLGLVPALMGFFGLGLDVRHVTLASGQLGAALGALGFGVLQTAAFWWCVAGIAVTGVLNLTVSFGLAFMVALRSRGVQLKEQGRILAALRRRLFSQPLSFLFPPRG
jgi:site-specific recombinase